MKKTSFFLHLSAFFICVVSNDVSITAEESTKALTVVANINGTQPTPTNMPTASPIPDLPFNDVNLLVITDVHSWVGGHTNPPELDAGYGDILSFYHHAKTYLEQTSAKSLWMVENGDFMHGSLLGEDENIESYAPILNRMPWDLVNIGNHELKSDKIVKFLLEPGSFVDWLGQALVTSNIIVKATGKPMGNRYRHLESLDTTALAFGFLYNMEDHSSLVNVEKVQDVVEQPWFRQVLEQKNYDSIIVMAHMDAEDDLIKKVILPKIRSIAGKNVPIQFIAGHSHVRAEVQLDQKAHSFEAGRYLDTLGFVSLSKKGQFKHKFIDGGTKTFQEVLNRVDYMTKEGLSTNNFIHRVRDAIEGTNEIIGCSPIHYRANGYLNQTDSLLRLHMEEIMPFTFLRPYDDGNNVLMHRIVDFIRYDLYPGEITMNDIIAILPEDETITKIAHSLRGDKIQRLVGNFRKQDTFLNGTAPTWAYMSQDGKDLVNDGSYELFAFTSQVPPMRPVMKAMRVRHPVDILVHDGEKTLRDVWIEFIKAKWPYNGTCSIQTDPVQQEVQSEGFIAQQAPRGVDLTSHHHQQQNGEQEKVQKQNSPRKKAFATTGIILSLVGVAVLVFVTYGLKKQRREKEYKFKVDVDGSGYRDNLASKRYCDRSDMYNSDRLLDVDENNVEIV